MGKSDMVNLLRSGVQGWNEWRNKNPQEIIDLVEVDLEGAFLVGANLGHANLKCASLVGANLSEAILDGADLCRADLKGAIIRGACLCGASLDNSHLYNTDFGDADLGDTDFRKADLGCANLTGARMRGANLKGAILNNTIGNGSEIMSIRVDKWAVAYTAEVLQIGCERHPISWWWEFGDEEIARMHSDALGLWHIWKPILQQIIAAAPATPTNEIEKRNGS